MRIDWWTLGLQTINLLVLLWLLGRFLFRPMARIVAQRQAAAAQVLDQADQARASAKADAEAAAKERADAAGARGALLKTAEEEAATRREALIAAARADADKLRADAQAGIARIREAEAAADDDRASSLAADIAGRLLGRLPDAARIDGFVDGLAKGVADLPEATRAEIGKDGAPVRLKAARALTPAEDETCRKAIGAVLGHPVDLAVEADPALIAGLELEAPHAVVRNHFRNDLDRIRAGLTRHVASQS